MKLMACSLLAVAAALLVVPPARAQSVAPQNRQLALLAASSSSSQEASQTSGPAAAASAAQARAKAEVSHTFLKVGDMAPDFTLKSDQGTTVTLSDFRGKKNVIVAFYVLAFTGG